MKVFLNTERLSQRSFFQSKFLNPVRKIKQENTYVYVCMCMCICVRVCICVCLRACVCACLFSPYCYLYLHGVCYVSVGMVVLRGTLL